MPTGKQGAPTGLAKAFVEYLRDRIADQRWTLDIVAAHIGKSKNYVASRLREEALFTVQDFEMVAIALGLEPQEMLARIQFPAAAHYEGRLVPLYGVVGDRTGMTIYRETDADPGDRPDNVHELRPRVGGRREDLREVAFETEHDHSEDTDDKYTE